MRKHNVDTIDDEILVDHKSLAFFITETFVALGLPEQAAILASDVLITADLRGISSHGCARLRRFYVPLLQRGIINPTAQLCLLQNHTILKSFDANAGLGLALAPLAIKYAIDSALEHGIGLVWVTNSSHFGIASYYTLKAAEAGMVGITLTNGNPAVAPPGSERALLGTNGISVACPGDDFPLAIDLAMSATSLGHLEDMAVLGKMVPAYFAADGLRQTMQLDVNREISPSIISQNRMIAPLGGKNGLDGEYRGFALSLIVELLTSIIPGGQMSFQLKRGGACHFFAVINPNILQDVSSMRQKLDALSETLEHNPTLPGYSPYRFPGSRSHQIQIDRVTNGIPLRSSTISDLSELAEKLQIPTCGWHS